MVLNWSITCQHSKKHNTTIAGLAFFKFYYFFAPHVVLMDWFEKFDWFLLINHKIHMEKYLAGCLHVHAAISPSEASLW